MTKLSEIRKIYDLTQNLKDVNECIKRVKEVNLTTIKVVFPWHKEIQPIVIEDMKSGSILECLIEHKYAIECNLKDRGVDIDE